MISRKVARNFLDIEDNFEMNTGQSAVTMTLSKVIKKKTRIGKIPDYHLKMKWNYRHVNLQAAEQLDEEVNIHGIRSDQIRDLLEKTVKPQENGSKSEIQMMNILNKLYLSN